MTTHPGSRIFGVQLTPEQVANWSRIDFVMWGELGMTVVPRAPTSGIGPQPDPIHPLLSRQVVAKWLGVSTRWVERHLSPSVQATKRGRAWYDREDLTAQLRELRVDKPGRGRDSSSPSPAKAAARRRAATGTPAFEGAEHARAVGAIEQQLRDGVAGAEGRRRLRAKP